MASQEEKDFSANLRNRAEEEEELQTRAFAAEEECKKSFVSSNEKITASCVSESCHSGPEGRTGEFSRANSIAAEGMRGSFDSEDLELRKKSVNGDDGLNKEMTFLEHEMARSQIQEREVPHEKPCAERGALKDSASENILEVKKKMLLEELETALLPEGELAGDKVTGCKLVKEDSKIPRSLGIEVIDDTALIDTIPGFAMAKKNDLLGYRKCTGKDVKKEIDVRNVKRSRRKARGAKHVLGMDGKDKRVTQKDGTQRKYSREEIEAVRFVNIEEQRKIWKTIYSRLDTAVAKEYDNLACSEHQQCFAKKKEAPAVLSAVCCENMDMEFQQMDSNDNVSPVDLSCGHIMGKDDCILLGESSGSSDSDNDYESIQKPAFFVDGEPNFDSGPPEDGWEYLRRVRWEAAQIPKVKVAKVDRSKLCKEQSAYLPQFPDIAECPEHLLPLKQWEDVFLAQFSELRENLSQLAGSSEIYPQPARLPLLPCNNFEVDSVAMTEDVSLHNHKGLGKLIDQQTILIAERKDTSVHSLNVSVGQSSHSYPLLSAILRMEPLAQVSMLQKRISSLESANTITRNDYLWLFALCATVDVPMDADTCATLRNLLRKCASLRATKTELDDEVVMLNILSTLSGRYFGQAEN